MDMYDDDGMESESKPPMKEEGDGQSALLPKSLFPGKDCKPGEKITLTVKHVYDDEIEVGSAEYEKDDAPEDDEMEVKPPADMEEDSMYA